MVTDGEDGHLSSDRFAETTLHMPMARNWQDLARSHRRAGDLPPDEGADLKLPPNHPGPAFARWRGWMREK